jgi:hypothetical protein
MQQMFQLSGKQFICFAEATRTAGRGIEIQLADLKSCLAVGWLMSITAFASTSITGSQPALRQPRSCGSRKMH